MNSRKHVEQAVERLPEHVQLAISALVSDDMLDALQEIVHSLELGESSEAWRGALAVVRAYAGVSLACSNDGDVDDALTLTAVLGVLIQQHPCALALGDE